MEGQFKILLFIGNKVKEFNSCEAERASFIEIHKNDLGLKKSISLPLSYENNQWVAKNSKDLMLIYEEKEIQSSILESGILLKYKVRGTTRSFYLFVVRLDNNYTRFNRYFLEDNREITIGSLRDSVICYTNTGVSRLHAKIVCSGDSVLLHCIKRGRIYINGITSEEDIVQLKFGDEVNIMGLKIVILDRFILMNNPERKVVCQCKPANSITLEKTKAPQEEVEVEYYTKTPRLFRKIDDEVVDIDAPPGPITQKQQPLLLTIGPSLTMAMAMLASLTITINNASKNGNIGSAITSGIMAVSMLIGALMWPSISRKYQKKQTQLEEKNRVNQYLAYIESLDKEIFERVENNRKIKQDVHPEPNRIIERVESYSRKVWERTIEDIDFADVRIGLGEQPNDIKLNVPKEKFSLVVDSMKDKPTELRDKYEKVPNMPITIPLKEDVVVGIIGKKKERRIVLNNMIVQLAGLHSYDELKIIMVCNESQIQEFEWVKYLPHNWSNNKKVRYFATNREEAHEVFTHIDEIIREREEATRESDKNKKQIPYFVAFILDIDLVADEAAMRYLAEADNKVSVSSVFVGDTIQILPSDCQTIIQYDDKNCSVFRKKKPEDGQLPFKSDYVKESEMINFARQLSQYQIKIMTGDQSIPDALDFLGMWGVGRVEHLDVGKRWQESMPHKSLDAPIGVKAGGELFGLNIHEKYHGPHGLVAGMTGSGKSEFIQAYILSMAINYHPHDVSFILIDYKGGGMANCFKGMPHVSGVITNLGGNQIRRSLLSIDAELKRRQYLFDLAGVRHIDGYQMKYKENLKNPNSDIQMVPLPHLVIVSDEFAELKHQQPEFMEKLVSAARIGRSLGVHLILATQKPSGVVDDQIWSNTRFRVCLKVLDRQDSHEMIKRPEAAAIKLPGRCYVQVGYNEIFECVQSGYSGLKYYPEDTFVDAATQRITLVDNCARTIKTATNKKEHKKTKETQIEAIVKYLNNYADSNNIEPLLLWTDPLKEVISLDELSDFSERGFDGTEWRPAKDWMRPIIGMVDDPERQRQFPLTLDIGNKGHVVLYGIPGTGKTTFIQTLLYSVAKMYSPDHVVFYVMDFGGRTLGLMGELPHCLGIAFTEDEEKVEMIFESITQELEHRRLKFSSVNVGNIQAYQNVTNEVMPAILLVIDNYSVFRERFENYGDTMITIAREAANYGIYLVLTGSDKNAIYYKVTDYIKQFLTLQLNDKSSYIEVLGQTNGLQPEPFKGRGLVKLEVPLEYQTALCIMEEDEAKRAQKLREIFKEMRNAWNAINKDKKENANLKARQLQDSPLQKSKPADFTKEKTAKPEAPQSKPLNLMVNYDKEVLYDEITDHFVPFAWDAKTGEALGFDFSKRVAVFVGGEPQSGKTNTLQFIIHSLKRYKNHGIHLFHPGEALRSFCTDNNVDNYLTTGEAFDNFLDGFVKVYNERLIARRNFCSTPKSEDEIEEHMHQFEKQFIIIDGFSTFHSEVSNKTIERLTKMFELGLEYLNIYFITAEETALLAPYISQDIYYRLVNTHYGVLLGGNINNQTLETFSNMSYKERMMVLPSGQGFFYEDNQHKLVKIPLYE